MTDPNHRAEKERIGGKFGGWQNFGPWQKIGGFGGQRTLRSKEFWNLCGKNECDMLVPTFVLVFDFSTLSVESNLICLLVDLPMTSSYYLRNTTKKGIIDLPVTSRM